ncbi:glycosyltransferase family 9 protein [Dictyobacter arantiisoli]|uniref:Glycosyl transferase n=1 Tax=Dictyobacter arantiisoli TaxID=2014874 RepID=A0A5A5T7X8_9CHLR|nr:glycosyltransferase family 9 protein [Dictyobacter arantiisoli]GCF07498.1 hypothetical protein KDI_10620 [Dictyobacter arantiisoli]
MQILIIRPGAIGDTLLTLPLLRYIRTHTPDPQVTFVGNSAVLPLIQAWHLAERTSNYENRLWSGLFMQPSISTSTRPAQQQLQQCLQRIERAICWLPDPDDCVKRNLQATGIAEIAIAPGRPTQAIPILSYLAQSIGITDLRACNWQPPQEYEWIREEAQAQQHRTIAIHPGSGGSHKCWPVTHFATVIRSLWQQQIAVNIFTGPADYERQEELLHCLPPPPQADLLRLSENVPLLTVAQELRHCCGYLGNDTGITHLAALLGLPTLALFGPSNPTIWKPIGPRVTVLYEPSLASLAPQQVLPQLLAGLHADKDV